MCPFILLLGSDEDVQLCCAEHVYADGGIKENVFLSPHYNIILFSFEGFIPLFPV